MTAPTSRESEKFVLRLPDGMRDRIKAAADANGRSMNAEVIARLEASFVPLSSREDAQEYARRYGNELLRILARDFPNARASSLAKSADGLETDPKERKDYHEG